MNKNLKIIDNKALKILKQVYDCGDDYSQQETETHFVASFSNDYPLQHGKGWTLKISKKDNSFNVNEIRKYYRKEIQKLIESDEK